MLIEKRTALINVLMLKPIIAENSYNDLIFHFHNGKSLKKMNLIALWLFDYQQLW